MPRKPDAPHGRHHIHIYDDDWEFLQAQFGPGSAHPLGASVVIKSIVRKYCRALRAKQAEALDAAGEAEQE